MCGRDLQESSGKLRLGIGRVATLLHSHDNVVVFDNRNHAPNNRQTQLLATHLSSARILRIECHGGIAKHGFRACGGHGDIARAIFKRVAEVPEVPIHFLHLHFIISECSARYRIPIDQPLPAIDQAVIKEFEECSTDSRGAHRIHGESNAVIVTRCTHQFQLAENGGFVLILPLLNLRYELLPSEIRTPLALLQQTSLHH